MTEGSAPERGGPQGAVRPGLRALTRSGAVAGAVALAATLLLISSVSATAEATALSDAAPMDAALAIAFAAYGGIGAFIAHRRPRNRVGWILLGAGLSLQLWMVAHWYAVAGLDVWPGRVPGAVAALWLSLWVGVPGFVLAFGVLPQRFPDGSALAGRWRVLSWFTWATMVVWAVTWATAPGPMASFAQRDNPVGVGPFLDEGLGWLMFVVCALASAVSLVVRYRRSRPPTRRQIRWLAGAAGLMGAALVLTTLGSEGVAVAGAVANVLFPLAVVGVLVASLIAILQHDLYGLDDVLSRSLTFGVLVGTITLAYIVAVAAVGAVAGVVTEVGLAVAVVVTGVVAVAFQPLRARVARRVNHLVYGERASPYEIISDFSRQLGSTVGSDDALVRIARVVADGVGADASDVWLALDGRLHRLGAWPHDRRHAPADLVVDALADLADCDHAIEIRHDGTLVGAITVVLAEGAALNATEARLLDDLAGQAGFVLHNVRLVEELRRSRQRLVAAQDEERRRIERDIHDGVQQRIVTLAMQLRMAADRAPSDSEDLAFLLQRAACEASDTLSEMRRLARGIHPAVVTEGGLESALALVADRAPIPVALDVEPNDDPPDSAAITAYYFVAEALTNVAKHAHASAATVSVRRTSHGLAVEVADDGVGGAAPGPGSGLTGMADRVAAVGGRLVIDSPHRGGTRVCAEIPCGP